MKNYKFINDWLAERELSLANSFAATLREKAKEFAIKNGVKLCEVYSLLGCSRQNVSYWELHSDSTQSRHSIRNVIERAERLFELNADEAETLANSAGLSLSFEGGDLLKDLGYEGRKCDLCRGAVISERMLEYYKKTPTKQALIAIAVYLKLTVCEMNRLLKRYGYCLSESSAADAVTVWFMKTCSDISGAALLEEINDVLEKMGLPLLMTR